MLRDDPEEGRRAWGMDCDFKPDRMFRKDLAEMLLLEQRCGGANPAGVWRKGIPGIPGAGAAVQRPWGRSRFGLFEDQ